MAKKRKQSRARVVTCEVCQSEFETNHSQGKYCSDKCKLEGVRKSYRKYGRRNRTERREYYKQYYEENKEKETARIARYQKSEAGKRTTKKSNENMRARYPEKYQARKEVLMASRKGILVKQPCEICKDKKTQAHHTDYSKPLDVTWLCSKCHKDVHAGKITVKQ